MKIERHSSSLTKEKKKKAYLLVLCGALLSIAFMQSFIIVSLLHYAHSHHDVRFIPPHISGEFTLSGKGVSDGYLRDMTHFFSQLRFNVTASSAVGQFSSILNYVSPSLYGEFRAQLVKEIEQITHEHLSSVFFPTSYEVDNSHFNVKVSGEMRRFVGADLMSDVKETFLFKYSYDQGLLKITAIEKV